MVDFHCHLLPAMDDGSDGVDTSLAMIALEQSQGVETILATPHFYGDQETPSAFLERRKDAWQRLQTQCEPDAPKIMLGAEVFYYRGISQSDCLSDFCVEGTNLLLLELPFAPCPNSCYQEVEHLWRLGFMPMIAHVERYLPFQPDRHMVARLRDLGALIQCNSAFFLQGWKSHKAFSMFKKAEIDALGSDSHNLTTRPPNLGKAMETLTHKFGAKQIGAFQQWSADLLDKATIASVK